MTSSLSTDDVVLVISDSENVSCAFTSLPGLPVTYRLLATVNGIIVYKILLADVGLSFHYFDYA